MNASIEKILNRFSEIENMMADSAVITDSLRLRELAVEHGQLWPVVETWKNLDKVRRDLEENRQIIESDDTELAGLASEEMEGLERRETELAAELEKLLVPADPLDEKNLIMEIRAGTGGEEAALFAGDLFRMYGHYIESQGWRKELVSLSGAEKGGIKEVIFAVRGAGAFGKLKFESGVHRVQRVPVTEASGRIHTSAATVAVLPEAEDVDVKLEEKDLKIDVFRSSGPGGQSVNTTDSAVRVTHLPTGLVVTCQDQKSQLQNKIRALEVLRARLLDRLVAEQEAARSRERRNMVGTGDRSAKIRTYNFPQNRVTDHRINVTLHRLADVIDGDLDELMDQLEGAYREERVGV